MAQVDPDGAPTTTPVLPRHAAGDDGSSLAALNAIGRIVECPAGSILFREQEPSEALYRVMTGCVKLLRLLPDGRCGIVGFLDPGAFCGLTAGHHHLYSAIGLTDCVLQQFPRRSLDALVLSLPAVERQLLASLRSELQAAQDHMLLLGRMTAQERVAAFLLERGGQAETAVDHAWLPMSRADMADYLGLTMETVSRTLTAFRRNGILFDAGSAVLRFDRAALLAMLDRR